MIDLTISDSPRQTPVTHISSQMDVTLPAQTDPLSHIPNSPQSPVLGEAEDQMEPELSIHLSDEDDEDEEDDEDFSDADLSDADVADDDCSTDAEMYNESEDSNETGSEDSEMNALERDEDGEHELESLPDKDDGMNWTYARSWIEMLTIYRCPSEIPILLGRFRR